MEELTASTIYFKEPGKHNTDRTLELAHERANALGMSTILVATTTGYTGVRAVQKFNGFDVIVVTHSTGSKAPNTQELTSDNRKVIEENSGHILTCQHALGGINRAVRRKLKTYQLDEIIAYTLRIFGEGMKVVVEMALMAADAGLVRTDRPVIAIAGTGSGADTAVVLLPVNAQNFFDLKIVEVICRPSPDHTEYTGHRVVNHK